MKKLMIVSIVAAALNLSGCMTEGVIKQMSADCAAVGGKSNMSVGMFGPRFTCIEKK